MPTDLPPTCRPGLTGTGVEPPLRRLGQSLVSVGCLAVICGLGSGFAAFCVAAGYRLASAILP